MKKSGKKYRPTIDPAPIEEVFAGFVDIMSKRLSPSDARTAIARARRLADELRGKKILMIDFMTIMVVRNHDIQPFAGMHDENSFASIHQHFDIEYVKRGLDLGVPYWNRELSPGLTRHVMLERAESLLVPYGETIQ